MVAAVAVQVQQAGVEIGARHPLQGLLQEHNKQIFVAGCNLLQADIPGSPTKPCTETCMRLSGTAACCLSLLCSSCWHWAPQLAAGRQLDPAIRPYKQVAVTSWFVTLTSRAAGDQALGVRRSDE